MKTSVFFNLLTLFLILSCGRPVRENRGIHRSNAVIYADESFQLFIETAGDTYEGRFPEKTLHFKYVPETVAMNALITDAVKTIFVSRDFTNAEKAKLRKSNIVVTSTVIAHDAIALIVNGQVKDTTITMEQLKRLLTQSDNRWPSTGKPIQVIVDNSQSANFNYLLQLIKGKPFGKNVFAEKSNQAVIEFVKKNPTAIGIIGYTWLADEDDPRVTNFRNGITIMRVAKSAQSTYYLPYYSTIDHSNYPLCRAIWAINKSGGEALTTSFINFLEGDIGQRLVDKAGLVPARKTAREITILSEAPKDE
jgi:phosphate transport system substrate-binding protein